ncbi:MAG TPA: DUF4097 family beta strand repeat-containing protein [Terriglobales bacterium]|jgi:DUF4097 and DUF4098 domain-containing protein YvlB|nr:DUF4097 family beta strand repeat-containing protein [Terriglobales bacterium]
MVTKQRVGEVAVVVVACVIAVAASEKKEFKYTVGPRASVTINNQFGPVSVKPSAGNQVIITAILQSNKVEVDDSKIGDRVELKSHLLQGATPENARVEYEAFVPADASVSIHSTNGPVRAEQLHGDLTLEGDTATMEVHDISDAHVHVNSLNGPITLTNIHNGHVEISSVGGDVMLNSVTGPLVSVTSTTGKIHYDGDFGIGGDYKLTSHSGDIEAIIPADASFDVTAKSMRGDVQNDFPLQPKQHITFLPEKGRSFVGTAGRAASSVLLRTVSGKIRLKKR